MIRLVSVSGSGGAFARLNEKPPMTKAEVGRCGRSMIAVAVTLSLVAGCRSTTRAVNVAADRSRDWLLIETLPSRHLVCREPERAREVLLRFIRSLGEAATLDLDRCQARINSDAYNDAVLRWRIEGNDLHVVAQESKFVRGFAEKLMSAFDRHLRVAGLYGVRAPFSGLMAGPDNVDGIDLVDAVSLVLKDSGFGECVMDLGLDSNAYEFAAAPSDSPAFRVDVFYFGGGSVQLQVTNVHLPFDGKSEETILREAVARLTPRPIAYGEQHIKSDDWIISGPR